MTDDELKKLEELVREEQQRLRTIYETIPEPARPTYDADGYDITLTPGSLVKAARRDWNLVPNSLIKEHDDQARCQESYDQGYQDGLEAAKEESK